jgi:pyridoxine/pyridoxamine 5'-phosphate oxidase
MNFQSLDSITISDIKYDLQSLEALAWKKLLNGSVKKKNGFRTMCASTVNKNNEASLRIVINRKVDEAKKTIYFYTDNRSRKFYDLQKDNRISLLFYDPRQKVQIVVKAYTKFHTDNLLSKDKWKSTSAQARLGYMTILPPNTKSITTTLGYENRFSDVKPTDEESNLYENNFSVIACEVYDLEFLYLDYLGNRKANFYYKNGDLTDCYWVVP